MPERSGPIFHATIDAFLRGVEFAGEGTIELVGEALGLTVGKRRALVAFGRLDGLREAPGTLELFADTGDTIAMFAASGLDVLAGTILTSAHAGKRNVTRRSGSICGYCVFSVCSVF